MPDTPEPQTVAAITIPLHITISLGHPGAALAAAGVTPAAPPLAPAPLAAAAVEGLFHRPPPVAAADLPYAFSRSALAAAAFDWDTALTLALASRLAYEDGPAVRATCAAWQLDDSRFVAADETECFVAWTPAAVVVAFRGTASPGDWLADLNIQSTKRDYGIVHRGFYTAFKVVEPQLRAALGGVAGRPVVLTGHSLGGALAAVAAAEWADAFPVASLYTYGQPATGKHGFANFLAAKYPDRIFRVVNDDDIVPQVPPTFEHVGRLLRFDGSGNLRPGTESVGTDTARVMSRPGFDRLRMQLLERRLAGGAAPAGHAEGLFPSVSDHSLDRYLERIARMV